MSAPIVFLDTEADGLHPTCQPYEIAMILRYGSDEASIQFFVEIDLSTADPFGLKVGRFYDRHPVGKWLSQETKPRGPAFGPLFPKFDTSTLFSELSSARLVAKWTHDAHIVASNPAFDMRVLGTLLRRNGLVPSWSYHLIDVRAMALGYLAGTNNAHPVDAKSNDLAEACGVEPPTAEERHTAMGDARWVQRWYDAITGGAA